MKILHIGLSKNKGGIESFAINYFKTLRKFGVVFDFADIYGDGIAYSDEIEKLGGKIITFKNFKKHPIKTRKDLANYIKSENYTAVHVHIQTAANLIPVLACKDAGVKPILHCHTAKAQGFIRKFLHNLNVSKIRKAESYRLACGEVSGKWFFKENFTVIPNAINCETFKFNDETRRKVRNSLNYDVNDFILGYIGRLEEVKNPLFTVEVLRNLTGNDKKLLILGEGSLKEKLISLINEYQLVDRVTVLGYTPNVYEYLCAIDVFLMPSYSEAFSISAIEAQASGLPCIFNSALPIEMDVLSSAKFLPISEPKLWAEEISGLNKANAEKRVNDNALISKSVYNLEVGSKILYDFYHKIKGN